MTLFKTGEGEDEQVEAKEAGEDTKAGGKGVGKEPETGGKSDEDGSTEPSLLQLWTSSAEAEGLRAQAVQCPQLLESHFQVQSAASLHGYHLVQLLTLPSARH